MMMDGARATFGSSHAIRFDADWPEALQKEAVLLMQECGDSISAIARRTSLSTDALNHLTTGRVQLISPAVQGDIGDANGDPLSPIMVAFLDLVDKRSAAGNPVRSTREAAGQIGHPLTSAARVFQHLRRAGLIERSGQHHEAGAYTATPYGRSVLAERGR